MFNSNPQARPRPVRALGAGANYTAGGLGTLQRPSDYPVRRRPFTRERL